MLKIATFVSFVINKVCMIMTCKLLLVTLVIESSEENMKSIV
jgi:hypothetical protein